MNSGSMFGCRIFKDGNGFEESFQSLGSTTSLFSEKKKKEIEMKDFNGGMKNGNWFNKRWLNFPATHTLFQFPAANKN